MVREDLKLSVETDEFSLLGSYPVKQTATTVATLPPVIASTEFLLKVSSKDCEEETVAITEQIDPFEYNI